MIKAVTYPCSEAVEENTHQRPRKSWIPNRCLWRARWLYALCKLLHLKGDWCICIGMRCREEGDALPVWGHAWLTRDGQPFMESRYDQAQRWVLIGEEGHYRYLALDTNHS